MTVKNLKLYKGKTKNGKWVTGNLIHTKDVANEYQAIIVPIESNGMILNNDDELSFFIWYKVDINSIEVINSL